MGVSLETWRARIGTFPQRPRPKKSSAPMCVGRNVMAGLPRITLLKCEEEEGWRDKKETSLQRPRLKNSRAVLCECREFIAGLLGLTLLLSLCQLTVGTHSPTFDLELLCSIRTPPTGTRVCTFSTSNTQYYTTTLEFWNLAEDNSSKIEQKGYAMSRRLLMLSGDVELNPGPNKQQEGEIPRSVFSIPILDSPWCVAWTSDNRVFFHNPSQHISVFERPEELQGRPDVDTLIQSTSVSQEMTASTQATQLHQQQSQWIAAQQMSQGRLPFAPNGTQQAILQGDMSRCSRGFPVQQKQAPTKTQMPLVDTDQMAASPSAIMIQQQPQQQPPAAKAHVRQSLDGQQKATEKTEHASTPQMCDIPGFDGSTSQQAFDVEEPGSREPWSVKNDERTKCAACEDVWRRSVMVEGFDPSVSTDILELYFGDFEETGGGPIEQIEMNGNGRATVVFEEPEVAERVLQRPQMVEEIPVVVKRPPPTEVPCTVKVSGLDIRIRKKKTLELFFKNKDKSGGGPIANLDVDETEGTALVTFHSAEDAQRVVVRGQHSLGGCEFTTAIVQAKLSDKGLHGTGKAGSDEKGRAIRSVTQHDRQQGKTERVATVMSEEDKDILTKSLPQLISNIGIEDGMLLAHLRSRGALAQNWEEYIKSKGNRNSQVKCLIDILLKGDSNTVDKFIYSLRDTGQSNVAEECLRPPIEDDSWGLIDHTRRGGLGVTNFLSEADRNLLEKCRPWIMRDLKLVDGSLLAELRARSILTDHEEVFIKDIKGNGNAVGKLIDKLLSKPPSSLEGFLHALNHSGHSFIVDYLRRPTTLDETPGYVRGGSSTTELENALRENLADRLNDWKTALEEGSGGQEPLQYIDQPCSVTVRTKGAQESTMDRAIQIVEKSVPGDTIVVFGDAGMGKTTLLKELARSWIEMRNMLAEKFKYVFLIPCRLVAKISLLNIICDELQLIPVSNTKELKKSLYLNERSVLFLIDSYEELRGDVAKADKTEINDLIAGRLFEKSTVIVTSRPGSRLRQSEHQKTAHLKDLPEEKVKDIIREQFCEDQDAANRVLESFPAMSFLQKPINLALFLYIVQHREHLQNIVSFTQAELFSQVLQYNMLAFTKKKKWEEFTPQPGSYIMNRDIPIDTRSRFREIAKKCFEEKKQNNVILHIEESDEVSKYLEFGLFTAAGPDTNSVLLPHPLFQEYFVAAHLAEDSEAWAALFEKIKEKSESGSYRGSYRGFQFVSGSVRPSLVDVLGPMGLNNVVRFLVSLKPQVCEQIGELFVVERWIWNSRKKGFALKVEDYDDEDLLDYLPVNLDYETELIRESCYDDNGKRVLAAALVNAPVRDLKGDIWHYINTDDGSGGFDALRPHLTDDQYLTFLRRVYNSDRHPFGVVVSDSTVWLHPEGRYSTIH